MIHLSQKRSATLLLVVACLTLDGMDTQLQTKAQTAQAQERDRRARLQQLRALNSLWLNGQYKEVAPRLVEYREGPFGKNILVDYMLGTSWCHIAGNERFGLEWLRRKVLPLANDLEETRKVTEEIEKCGTLARPREIFISSLRGSSITFRGKSFNLDDTTELKATATKSLRVIRSIENQELMGRVFEPSRRAEALRRVRGLLGPSFRIVSVGHFIIASRKHSSSQLTTLAGYLDKYLQFFASQYGMSVPHELITVYLVPDLWMLSQLAYRIHGVAVADSIIGYSFPEDMSIVSVTPGRIYGTVNHELFHLMVRQNFGDIPPWLEEGLAALYESSIISGNEIRGVGNWRFNVLRREGFLTPGNEAPTLKLRQLIEMNWHALNRSNSGFDRTTAEDIVVGDDSGLTHAVARSFMLYLQEKHKLLAVYRAFKNNEVKKGEVLIVPRTPTELLEMVLDKPMSEIESDFISWLKVEIDRA